MVERDGDIGEPEKPRIPIYLRRQYPTHWFVAFMGGSILSMVVVALLKLDAIFTLFATAAVTASVGTFAFWREDKTDEGGYWRESPTDY